MIFFSFHISYCIRRFERISRRLERNRCIGIRLHIVERRRSPQILQTCTRSDDILERNIRHEFLRHGDDDIVHLLSSCKIHLTAIRCGNLVHVVMRIEGRGTLTDHEEQDHILTLHQGETVLIPATSKGVTFTPSSGMKLITSYIG